MAEEVKAFKARGALFDTLEKARNHELAGEIAGALKQNEWASTMTIQDLVRKWKELYKVLENHARSEKLLGGQI